MRESRTSGSGRGDQGNPVPYRHRLAGAHIGVGCFRFCPRRDVQAARQEEGFGPGAGSHRLSEHTPLIRWVPPAI